MRHSSINVDVIAVAQLVTSYLTPHRIAARPLNPYSFLRDRKDRIQVAYARDQTDMKPVGGRFAVVAIIRRFRY